MRHGSPGVQMGGANRVFRGVLSVLLVAGTWPGAAEGDPAPADRDACMGALLVAGARRSIAAGPGYDPSYVRLTYPGGDPGWDRGACTDVVIRAFRNAGVDLQERVQEDLTAAPELYDVGSPDPSIDHRRVRNLKVFLERHALTLPLDVGPDGAAEWLPGDLVIWDLYGGNSPNHIGIVSDRRGESGHPLVIHHYARRDGFSGRPSEDDCLARWRRLGHYRWE